MQNRLTNRKYKTFVCERTWWGVWKSKLHACLLSASKSNDVRVKDSFEAVWLQNQLFPIFSSSPHSWAHWLSSTCKNSSWTRRTKIISCCCQNEIKWGDACSRLWRGKRVMMILGNYSMSFFSIFVQNNLFLFYLRHTNTGC